MITLPFGNSFAYDPADTDDTKSEKASIFLVATSCCIAGVFWSGMYLVAFGAGLTAALPLVFTLLVGSGLGYAHVTGNHRVAIFVQITCIIYITTIIQWRIGDVFDSGFVMAWAFMGPLIALMFLSVRQAVIWQVLFLVNVVATVILAELFPAGGEVVTEGWRRFFFVMNLSIASTVVFAFATYFVANALNEKQKADRLLLNILPEKTARALKSHAGVVAEEFESVSVLFADIVNYTQYSSTRKPAEVVATLNEIFNRFDELADRHGLEKIKTIGDAYMVVGGLPEPSERHAHGVANMALEMLDAIRNVEVGEGKNFSLRIGVDVGPVVAGVIGSRKFAYDLWGNTVNVASRLESHGTPDRIHVSGAFYRRLKDDFVFSESVTISVKGKGELETYFLVGRV
jgi:adenylate cyclase